MLYYLLHRSYITGDWELVAESFSLETINEMKNEDIEENGRSGADYWIVKELSIKEKNDKSM